MATFYLEATVYLTHESDTLEEAIKWAQSHTVFDMLSGDAHVGSVFIRDEHNDVLAEV